MAWERRGNHRYYYRSVRNGTKVKKIYLGCGRAAELAAQEFDAARKRRKTDREADLRHRRQYRAAVGSVDRLTTEVDAEMATVLSAAGCYRRSGVWHVRQKPQEDTRMNSQRVNGSPDTPAANADFTEPSETPSASSASGIADGGDTRVAPADQSTADEVPGDGNQSPNGNDDFRLLVERANGGDAEANKRLREILDNNPEVWQKIGDLAAHARLTLIRLIAGGDQLLFEATQRAAQEMEAELLGDDPTRMEQMLAERVIACWLQLQYADTVSVTVEDNLSQAKFWSQERDRAHRRYLTAVKALTTTRQLLLANVATRKVKRGNEVPQHQTQQGVGTHQQDQRADTAAAEAAKERVNETASGSTTDHTDHEFLSFPGSVAAN
ncbi:MAG: hypothetical protein RIC55_19190 [Pirellulaceae bacterium]